MVEADGQVEGGTLANLLPEATASISCMDRPRELDYSRPIF